MKSILFNGNMATHAFLNGNVIWRAVDPDYYVEYKIDGSSTSDKLGTTTTGGNCYIYLPVISFDNTDYSLDFDGVEITLKNGTVVYNIYKYLDILVSDIDTIKIFYSKEVTSLRFSSLASHNNLITELKYINISNFTSFSHMFYYCSKLTSLDLSNWNTESITDMSYMFRGCSSLSTIEGLESWDVSNITDMGCMFSGCESLTLLNISNWNVTEKFLKSVSSRGMFQNCKLLENLDLSKWGIKKLYGEDMFNGCENLITIKLPSTIQDAITLKNMFRGCSLLSTIEGLESWDVTSVTDMSYMFSGCSKLTSLDLSSWLFDNTWKLDNTSHMFEMCIRLSLIDLSSFITLGVSNYSNMFTYVPSSATIKIDSIAYKWLPDMTESTTGFKGTFIRV